jgi:hypothetical protein
MGCCRRARLNEEWRKAHPNATNSLEENTGATVGSIVHMLMELYYSRGKSKPFDTVAIRYVQDSGQPANISEEARLEAERLFRAYRLEYPPDEVGTVLGIEEPIENNSAVDEAVGIAPFSMRYDLKTRLNARQAKRLKATRRLSLRPGTYLWDHKTDKFRRANLIDYYTYSLQFTAYILGHNAMYPKAPVNGLIVNDMIKTKEVGFMSLFIPVPTKKRIAALHRYLYNAKLNSIEQRDEPNADRCFDWNKTCPHFVGVGGTCDRT